MDSRGEDTVILLSSVQCSLEEQGGIFVVLPHAALLCPVCASLLQMIGRRLRRVIMPDGVKRSIMIRRMRCNNEQCQKIHHELPDIIVPYKRHCVETIENIISSETNNVPCENITVNRIKAWWKALSVYFLDILLSFAARLNVEPPESPTFKEKIQAVVNSYSWTFPGRLCDIK